jgi:hypothetical protein
LEDALTDRVDLRRRIVTLSLLWHPSTSNTRLSGLLSARSYKQYSVISIDMKNE